MQLTASQRGVTKAGGLSNTLRAQKGQWAEKSDTVTYILKKVSVCIKIETQHRVVGQNIGA